MAERNGCDRETESDEGARGSLQTGRGKRRKKNRGQRDLENGEGSETVREGKRRPKERKKRAS